MQKVQKKIYESFVQWLGKRNVVKEAPRLNLKQSTEINNINNEVSIGDKDMVKADEIVWRQVVQRY